MMLGFWNGLWIEVAIVVVVIFAVYTSRQTNRVINLRPLKLPLKKGEPPDIQTRVDQQLLDLRFQWLGDFDASCNSAVVTRIRVYTSEDWRNQAIFVSSQSADENHTMVEFNADLSPSGNLCTNNNKLPSIYSYPNHKLIVRAPWKKNVAEIYALHHKLCEAVATQGFTPVPSNPERLAADVAQGSRRDLERERSLGRMEEIEPGIYTTTFKGAVVYAPKVWLPMAYGFLFGWYHPSDATLIKRAKERYQRAAREALR